MSNIVEFNKSYQIPADELFLLCVTTVEGFKMGKVSSTDPVMGKIKGICCKGWTSIRYGVEIEIIPSSQGACTLKLETYPLTGLGKRAKFGGGNVAEAGSKEFMEELQPRLDRFKIKYGS